MFTSTTEDQESSPEELVLPVGSWAYTMESFLSLDKESLANILNRFELKAEIL